MTRQEAIQRLKRTLGGTKIPEVADICEVMIRVLEVAVAKERQLFDKAAYQREYMRKWRARRKGATSS